MFKTKPLERSLLNNTIPHGTQKTYVVFNDGDKENPRWFTKYLKKGFKHCCVYHYDGYQWLKIEKNYQHTSVEILAYINDKPTKIGQDILEHLDGIVVEVDRESLIKSLNGKLRCFPFVLLNCSEYIKDFLGVSDYFIFTPYQLYKHLEELNNGYEKA